jgi:hypothetical protein
MRRSRANRPDNKLLYLPEHHPLFGTMRFVSKSDIGIGDVITFSYQGLEKKDITEVKWVFVLDPNWHGKLHGLTLGLTPKSELLQFVIDPMYDTELPYDLYHHDVFKVARDWDSYRTYFINKMDNTRRFPYFLTERPVIKDGKRIR